MSEPFLGELRLASFNFAPKGWAPCNGQLLPINQNQALFALLGTRYGGNGQTNFALPDLRGRVPMHMGPGFIQGTRAGQEAHTLTNSEMPTHFHLLRASTQNADRNNPIADPKGVLGAFNNGYREPSNLTTLLPATVSSVGGSQAHENRQPFAVLNWIIALQGIFPSRN